MNPDLEPEIDHGFGVGKKPATDYAEDEVIILDSMGCNFGTKTNPIVIDDSEEKKPEKKEPKKTRPKKVEVISSDEENTEDQIKKEKDKKAKFNERLFQK